MPLLQHIEKEIFAPDGIMVIDRGGKIIAFDEAAERLTGCSASSIISKKYTKLIGSSDSAQDILNKAMSQGEIYSNVSMNFSCAKGSKLHFLTSITPISQPGQGVIGIVVVFRNTAEMIDLFNAYKEKSHEILDEKNKLEAIFNSRWEGTFTIDKNWQVTSFNRSAERITGYSAKQVIGKPCCEIFKSTICQNGCHMEVTMKEQKAMTSEEFVIIHRDGHKVPIRVNSAPLYDGSNNFIGAVETFLDISEIQNLRQLLNQRSHFENIIGQSKSMLKIYDLIENVCRGDSNVLITGESGTGKEVIAQAIHKNSDRKAEPFMAVNCSAFAETLLESELFGHEKGAFTGAVRAKPGRFELAGNGILFLDEIGDLSLPIQVKLLRVLESRQYERVGGTKTLKLNARIISATHKDLELEIKTGRFREDLFYRIHVINIPLPPLRERMEDLAPLISFFINNYQLKFKKNIKSISPSAFNLLSNYQWPGNIRELENVLEHAFVVCHKEIIDTEHLPERIWDSLDSRTNTSELNSAETPLKDAEKQILVSHLQKFDGHRMKTAAALGIDKTTLWRKMKKFGML